MFFGRDQAIADVQEKLNELAQLAPAFLLLLGASGYGKSSLVRAGVVPQLEADAERGWLVLEPFSPGSFPFTALRKVLQEPLAAAAADVGQQAPPVTARGDAEGGALVLQLQWLQSVHQAPVLLVIDQFEELLAEGTKEGERFLAFLQHLLGDPTTGVMVLATMRTDCLDPLQTRWPALVAKASTETLPPIRPEDFGELISGPAQRSGLTLQPGLRERLVADSGGRDALPLLAFTLEKLWQKQNERGAPVAGPNGAWRNLTVEDYDALGGVDGAVGSQAKLCWDPQTSSPGDAAALREAFLEHLVRLGREGLAAKQRAPWGDLPEPSKPILKRFVDARLLVTDAGVVEIAHEALLRTWAPLVRWLKEGRLELEQRERVERLCDDLNRTSASQTGAEPNAEQVASAKRQRRNALDQLLRMAAMGNEQSEAMLWTWRSGGPTTRPFWRLPGRRRAGRWKASCSRPWLLASWPESATSS